jgi:hypothetical protein
VLAVVEITDAIRAPVAQDRAGCKGIDVKSYADGDVQALRVRAACTDAREARRS